MSQGGLNSLIEAKKAGATFGALTDKELEIITSAFSKIKFWERGTGKADRYYQIDEVNFKAEIKKIEDSAKKIKEAESGSNFSGDEQKQLDQEFGTFNPSSFYK